MSSTKCAGDENSLRIVWRSSDATRANIPLIFGRFTRHFACIFGSEFFALTGGKLSWDVDEVRSGDAELSGRR
jgi:hypothetical protein